MTIEELETYSKGKALPAGPIKLNDYGTIADPASIFKVKFRILHSNPENNVYNSGSLRLIEFKEWLDKEN